MSVFDGAELIDSYSRAQAIDDGVLVDVTSTAAEAGFSIPVAITRAVFVECVEWNPEHGNWQDEAGRLWDVVWMAFCSARIHRDTDRFRYDVLRVPNTPRSRIARRVSLICVVGPGDTVDPVLTIMVDGES